MAEFRELKVEKSSLNDDFFTFLRIQKGLLNDLDGELREFMKAISEEDRFAITGYHSNSRFLSWKCSSTSSNEYLK